MKFTRDFYYPQGALEVQAGMDIEAVCYTFESTNRKGETAYCVVGFHGKSQKPDFNFSYRTLEQRAAKIKDYFAIWANYKERMAKRKAERNAPMTLKVGDILVNSWGYDQTNIDFYEVTRLVGSRTVEIRAIKQNRTETGYMQGNCTPRPGEYSGEPMLKRVSHGESVKIHDWGSYAQPASSGPYHWTAYA